MRLVQFAVVILGTLGLCPLSAQTPQSAHEMDRTVVNGQSLRKAGAIQKVVSGFNVIGMQAANLRKTMSLDDAVIFDGLMLDVMAALAAIPEIGLKNWNNPETIKPDQPRTDRLVQLPSNLAGLAKLFSRARSANRNPAERKLLAAAQQSTRQISNALPAVLPIVSAKPRQK